MELKKLIEKNKKIEGIVNDMELILELYKDKEIGLLELEFQLKEKLKELKEIK